MPQDFESGDFLVFQLEAGFALLRVLGVDNAHGDTTWHIAAYSDLFPDVETAELTVTTGIKLSLSNAHIALTNRAFESTQVAKIAHAGLTESELEPVERWRNASDREISDRSVRLLLGLR